MGVGLAKAFSMPLLAVSDLFERAIAAGHGEEDVAALVKVLRHADDT
jgi:3-hydroxyisobutyrate dehydrogenase-like beta-hydroxyacid dehydrogenase